MNTNIQQLYNTVVGDDKLNFDSYLAENFAQSIVKECAKIAEDTQKFYDEHNDGVVNTEIWTMIKLHFGVQE